MISTSVAAAADPALRSSDRFQGGGHSVAALFISFPHPKMRNAFTPPAAILKIQEIPFDHPESRYMFRPEPNKPLVATPAALDLYGRSILDYLIQLQTLARQKNGLDYLQVFEDSSKSEPLWFIEDGEGGAITALLPSDY